MQKRSAEQDVNDLHAAVKNDTKQAKEEVESDEMSVIVTYLEWSLGEIMLTHLHGRVTAAEFEELRRAQFDDDSHNPSESESKFLNQLYKVKKSVDEDEGGEADETVLSERFSVIDTSRVYSHTVHHFFLNLGQIE